MKAHVGRGGVESEAVKEVQLHSSLTSALDGGEWSASRSGRFPPEEINMGSQGCVGQGPVWGFLRR